MTHWNHRVVRETTDTGETVYSFAEVSYRNGIPFGWVKDGVVADFDKLGNLAVLPDRLRRAVHEPVLNHPDDFAQLEAL